MPRGNPRSSAVVTVCFAVLICTSLFAANEKATTASTNSAQTSQAAQATNETTAVNAGTSVDQAEVSPIEGTDLARMLRRDFSRIVVRQLKNGATQVDPAGGFQDALIVQIGPDGKPVITCIASEKKAAEIFGPRKSIVAKEP